MVGFTDSYWDDDPHNQNSTAGFVFSLGLGPVTWAYKKQQAIVISSIEVEYQAMINASQETFFVKYILLEFRFWQQHLTTL